MGVGCERPAYNFWAGADGAGISVDDGLRATTMLIEEMRRTIRRLIWRFHNLKDGYHELNRRAKVESELFECATGKRPMPDKAQLKEWAMRLGVPESFQRRGNDNAG